MSTTLPALLPLDPAAPSPLYLQLASGVIALIRRGVWPPGARLPGTRAVAEALGIHRKTVVAAFDELLAQGWLETLPSRGTFVHRNLPEQTPRPPQESIQARGLSPRPGFPVSEAPALHRPVLRGTHQLAFNDGFPDVRLAPWEAFSRAFRQVLRQAWRKDLLFYSDVYGENSLRENLAAHLRVTRGIPLQADNLLITRGSTMGMYLCARTLLAPGDRVVVGELSYGSANLIFQQAGAQLLPVPVDAGGLDVDAIARLCAHTPPRMVYLTPHHHYPTTVTMPAERRLRLLQLAQQYHFCILEDDYDYDFHYDGHPVMPLAGVDDSGHVVYTGSFCKSISPALRLGYVAAPAELIQSLARYRRIVDRQGENLLEAALSQLFRDGDIQRHLKKAQKTYQQRRDVFCDLLQQELGHVLHFERPSGGMAVWARFDPAIALPQLAARARARGLYLSDGTAYAEGLNAARLGFASLQPEELEAGMAILKSVL